MPFRLATRGEPVGDRHDFAPLTTLIATGTRFRFVRPGVAESSLEVEAPAAGAVVSLRLRPLRPFRAATT